MMLLEVHDAIFQRMAINNVPLPEISALKVDGMQHCTVYTGSQFPHALQFSHHVGRNSSLDTIFRNYGAFSRHTSPIWEDATTRNEAQELTDILKTEGGIENLTANNAELRFPAAQIMKWMKQDYAGYLNTCLIQVLSAFSTSVLAGKIAPVDTGDGWGTNLNTMDILSPSFHIGITRAIEQDIHMLKSRKFSDMTGTMGATDIQSQLFHTGLTSVIEQDIQVPEDRRLFDLLGTMTSYDAVVGRVNNYFVKKYGLNPDALVLAGTGDNPATLLGAGGSLVMSLGSSYTLNGVQKNTVPTNGEDNVFGYTPGRTMSLICFTNGSKVRSSFVHKYIYGTEDTDDREISLADWDEFGKKVVRDHLGKYIMLPYQLAETVPVAPAGIVRQGFDDHDAAKNITALYFSQMAALAAHARPFGKQERIYLAGGAGNDPIMRQLAADLFDTKTATLQDYDVAAPLGCAISAMRQALRIPYEEATRMFVKTIPGTETLPTHDGQLKKQLQEGLAAYKKLEAARR